MQSRSAVLSARSVRLGVLALCAPLIAAQPPPVTPADHAGRVVLVSLDGMGTRLLLDDPVAEELQSLSALRTRGVMADGLVPHMPSTTANTHAALWTGAWGDVNGITSNDMPLPPRSGSAASARVSGYRSEGLRAEPIWVAAARQGVATVTQQATQVYPFRHEVTGSALATPPTLLHGYQAPVIAPARWLRARDVVAVRCRDSAAAATALACFTWSAGPVPMQGALMEGERGGRRVLRVRVAGGTSAVDAPLAPTEHEPPRRRDLARHFSDGLLVDMPGVAPVMTYFRLFEASDDGRSLLLFQSVMQESLLHTGRPATRAESIALLRHAGGFVGNGVDAPADADGAGGVPLWRGGDGTHERRYLETIELGMRQTIRQARHLWHTHSPRFMLGYVSMPDEMDHEWLGHARQDPRYQGLRRWGYQLVDRAAATYVGFVTPRDHVVFVSDHGMTAITHEARVQLVLRDAGLVAIDARGRVDADRSQVLFDRNCLRVHTTDWQRGIVPVADRDAVLGRALEALQAIRAPEDGAPVITRVFFSSAERERLGFGGPNGFDACVDVRPGYMLSAAIDTGPVVRRRARPSGEHGYLPTRPDMHGLLIAAGPRVRPGSRWPVRQAIDVAPLVSDLLGIEPPRDARGRSPLAR